MNEELRDPSGNLRPLDYVNSIEGRMLVVMNDLENAIWALARAQTDPSHHTKAEILEKVGEAARLLLRIRREFRGR